ncbi:MAG: caspase family protein [Spirochaetales bacterium]|nr:caspase family protein [Spirochaetales bacterium]
MKIAAGPKLFILITAAVFLLFFVVSCSLNLDLPKSYAMVYGISKYIDTLAEGQSPNLTYSDNDAIDVAAMLKQKSFTVYLRTNSAASKDQFLADINTINSEIGPNDLFLFYYSGHGAQDGDVDLFSKGTEPPNRDSDNEWILLYGSIEINGTSLLLDESKTFTDDQLKDELAKVNTTRKVVMLDSCNSGGFIGNNLEVDRVPQFFIGEVDSLNMDIIKEAFTLYSDYAANNTYPSDITPEDALVLSAAGEEEFSYEDSPIGHGLLTYFFLDIPKYADINKDGYVTVIESFAYIQAAINVNWNSYHLNIIENTTDSSDIEYYQQYLFSPHISGGSVDFVLFPAD